jgi:hypothetical protein
MLLLVGSVLPANLWSAQPQIGPTTRHESIVEADLVQLNDQYVEVRLDGELVRFQISKMHSYRVHDGRLYLRLIGGLVLAVSDRAGTFDQDSEWVTIRPSSHSPSKSPATESNASPQKPGDRVEWLGKALVGLTEQQREYRRLREDHRQRMLKWFANIEQAKRQGIESTALDNGNIFQTRELADAFAHKLSSQVQAAKQAEHIVRQALSAGGQETSMRLCARALRRLEQEHQVLSELGDALQQDMLENYHSLQGF